MISVSAFLEQDVRHANQFFWFQQWLIVGFEQSSYK